MGTFFLKKRKKRRITHLQIMMFEIYIHRHSVDSNALTFTIKKNNATNVFTNMQMMFTTVALISLNFKHLSND